MSVFDRWEYVWSREYAEHPPTTSTAFGNIHRMKRQDLRGGFMLAINYI